MEQILASFNFTSCLMAIICPIQNTHENRVSMCHSRTSAQQGGDFRWVFYWLFIIHPTIAEKAGSTYTFIDVGVNCFPNFLFRV